MAKYYKSGNWIYRENKYEDVSIYLEDVEDRCRYVDGDEVSSYGKRKLFQRYLYDCRAGLAFIFSGVIMATALILLVFWPYFRPDIEMENAIEMPNGSMLFTYEDNIYEATEYYGSTAKVYFGTSDEEKLYYKYRTKGSMPEGVYYDNGIISLDVGGK